MMLIDNKRGASLSILLLVLMVLLALGTTLFMFITENSRVNEKLTSPIILMNGLSDKEKVLNFYVGDVVNRSAKNINNKEEFMEKAGKLFEAYKNNLPNFETEFGNLVNELNEQNVVLVEDNGEIKEITFQFTINIEHSLDNGNKIIVQEPYSRSFSAKT